MRLSGVCFQEGEGESHLLSVPFTQPCGWFPAAPGHLPRGALHRGGSPAEHRDLPEPPDPDLKGDPGAEPGAGTALHLPGPSAH